MSEQVTDPARETARKLYASWAQLKNMDSGQMIDSVAEALREAEARGAAQAVARLAQWERASKPAPPPKETESREEHDAETDEVTKLACRYTDKHDLSDRFVEHLVGLARLLRSAPEANRQRTEAHAKPSRSAGETKAATSSAHASPSEPAAPQSAFSREQIVEWARQAGIAEHWPNGPELLADFALSLLAPVQAENERLRETLRQSGAVLLKVHDERDTAYAESEALHAELAQREERIAELERENRMLEAVAGTLPIAMRERDEARAALARAQYASRTRPDYDLHCQECGAPHWIDTVLPSETWNQIADPSDLLCMLCIDARLKAAGLHAEAEFYFGGAALVSKMYGQPDYGVMSNLHRQIADLSAALARAQDEALGQAESECESIAKYADSDGVRGAASWVRKVQSAIRSLRRASEEQEQPTDARPVAGVRKAARHTTGEIRVEERPLAASSAAPREEAQPSGNSGELTDASTLERAAEIVERQGMTAPPLRHLAACLRAAPQAAQESITERLDRHGAIDITGGADSVDYVNAMRGQPISAPQAAQETPDKDAEIYPCADCGVLRSKAQGAKIFTVCDTCWDKHYKNMKPAPARLNSATAETKEGEQ